MIVTTTDGIRGSDARTKSVCRKRAFAIRLVADFATARQVREFAILADQAMNDIAGLSRTPP